MPQCQEIVNGGTHTGGLVTSDGRETAARRASHHDWGSRRCLKVLGMVKLKPLNDEAVDSPRHPLHRVPVRPDGVVSRLKTIKDDGKLAAAGGIDNGLNGPQLSGA